MQSAATDVCSGRLAARGPWLALWTPNTNVGFYCGLFGRSTSPEYQVGRKVVPETASRNVVIGERQHSLDGEHCV